MKVCHVISGYHRNDARVFVRQCLSLRRAGYDVSILTNDGEPDQVLEGIRIVSCALHWPERWKVLMAAKWQFMSAALHVDADVYQLHSPELLPLAKPLKRLGKAVVYDAHEDLPRHLLETEWLPGILRRPFGFAAEQYLRRTLREMDDVVSPHSHVVAHLRRTIGKGTLVANFPIVQPLPAVTEAEFSARPPAICYTGTVYRYSNQEATLDALSQLPGIRYRVAGHIDQAHRKALEQRPGATQAEYLGRLSRVDLRALLTSSVAGLAVYDYKRNLGWKLGSYGTNKVFEYMEAGLPLICTDYDLWRDIVARYECGVCVTPGSVKQIRTAIEYVVSDRARAFRMGQNGRRAVLEEFNWSSEERKYLAVFERLRSTGKRRTAGRRAGQHEPSRRDWNDRVVRPTPAMTETRAPRATPLFRDWLGLALGSARAAIGTAGSLRRNALVLTVGTLTAQALPLLLYPVFTRMYAPAEFGVFATVSLFATVAAILASGAYESAVLMAPSRRVAAHIVAYSLLRSGVVLTALLLALLPIGDDVLMRLGVDSAVFPWLPVVPLVAAAVVVYNCYAEWCVRNQYFGELSTLRIWQTSAIAAARLGLGLFAPSINGFVAGDAVGKAASAGRSVVKAWARDRLYFYIHTVARLRAAARRYAHVARYALPDQLINTLGGSIHVVFLGAAFGTEQLGYVSLALSAMYVPVTVVSSAVKDVFRQRASVEYATKGTCRPTYRRLLVPVSLLAVAGFGILYVISPTLFPLVLGPAWAAAGEYARILTPLFFWNFVSMSLAGVLVIAERTYVSLGWQIANLALTIAALLVGTRVLNDIVASLWCYSLARALSYVLYMVLSYLYAERPQVGAA